MTTFKDYNGQEVNIPSHTHSVEDTKIPGTDQTALASTTSDGFMSKNDKLKLNTIEEKTTHIEEKLKMAVFIKEKTQLTFIYHKPTLKDDTGNPSANIFIEPTQPGSDYSRFIMNPRSVMGRYLNCRVRIPNIHLYPNTKYALLINDQSYFKVAGVGLGLVTQSDILKEDSQGQTVNFNITNFNSSDLEDTNLQKFQKCYFIEPIDHIFEIIINYNYTIEFSSYNEILRIGLFEVNN